MKIILDARKIDDFGIGEYIKNVFNPLTESGIFNNTVLFNREHPVDFGGNCTYIPIASKNYNIFEQLEIPLKMLNNRKYLFFSPHYIYPLAMSNRLIVTIHDLIHFKFPDFFGPKIKIRAGEYFLKTIRKKSLKIFCVSENTKNDLIDMFEFKDEQISVIYNSLNSLFFNLKKESSPISSPYILYTGNIKPHKNVSALIEAFRLIKPFFKNLKLVLAGAGEKIPEEYIHDDIRDHLITTGYLAREKLINYIDNAEIFVFPSFYEGFGFPPLEAMARGKAVISSPEGSLKEILGKAPLYFDPYSPQELSEKIILLLKNKKLRKETEEKGLERAKLFTAKKSVSLYLEELKKLSD